MRLHLSDLKKINFLRTILRLANNSHLELYLVGGCIRDCLLERTREYLDFDFALEKNSLKFAKTVANRLKAAFVLLDEPHGAARVVFKNKRLSANLDFSDFRADTIEQDLKLRDFTINSIAIRMSDIFSKRTNLSEAIIDPYNGMGDLKKRIVRKISEKSFRDDPLRMLRVFSISARLHFKIEKATQDTVKRMGQLIKIVSDERIREELFKIFSLNDSYAYLSLLEKSRLLLKIIPEIKLMHKLKGGPYHHLDVWRHSLETYKRLEDIITTFSKKPDLKRYLSEEISSSHKRLAIVKFGALLHDIGKPATVVYKEDKIHFYGHERIGAKIVEVIAMRLRLSTKEIKVLKTLVYCHLRPGFMADIQDLSRRALFRYFRDTGQEAVSVALISLADQRATRGRLKRGLNRTRHEQLIKFLIRHYFKQLKQEKRSPLINGHDVMRALSLRPGPIIGKILNEINEAQAEGKVINKRQALQWAKGFYKNTKENYEGV